MTRDIPITGLSVAEAAFSAGVSEEIIYAKIRTRELHAVRLGKEPGKGDLRVGLKELERLFAKPEEGS